MTPSDRINLEVISSDTQLAKFRIIALTAATLLAGSTNTTTVEEAVDVAWKIYWQVGMAEGRKGPTP